MISKEEENNVGEENVWFNLVIIHQPHSYKWVVNLIKVLSTQKIKLLAAQKKRALSFMNHERKMRMQKEERERENVKRQKSINPLHNSRTYLSVCSWKPHTFPLATSELLLQLLTIFCDGVWSWDCSVNPVLGGS